MIIDRQYITCELNRPVRNLKSVKGVAVHWIGVACSSAQVIRDNFQRGDRQGSTQFIIDYNNGTVIQTMPETEVAFHVGANNYTDLKEEIFGSENPNNFLIGIECCIGDKSIPNDYSNGKKYPNLGKPSATLYESLVTLCAELCNRYKLNPLNQLYRHKDITGKPCHIWFVNHSDKWAEFKNDVKTAMNTKSDNEEAEDTEMVYKTINDVPKWYKPTVEKLIATGAIKGDGKGNINLPESTVQALVINDRMGLYNNK